MPAAVIMCTESPYRAIQKRENVCLIGEQETDPVALLEDPYTIAWKLQKKDKLVPVSWSDPSGNFPVCMVFYKVWWKVCSQVHSERPIPSGGLEILLMAKLIISDENHRYFAHLKTLISKGTIKHLKKKRMICMNKEKDICDDNEDDTIILEDDEHDI